MTRGSGMEDDAIDTSRQFSGTKLQDFVRHLLQSH
jgi:hypothetical protein